jgi:hypothetical protein
MVLMAIIDIRGIVYYWEGATNSVAWMEQSWRSAIQVPPAKLFSSSYFKSINTAMVALREESVGQRQAAPVRNNRQRASRVTHITGAKRLGGIAFCLQLGRPEI